jgi:hypothetical protein
VTHVPPVAGAGLGAVSLLIAAQRRRRAWTQPRGAPLEAENTVKLA